MEVFLMLLYGNHDVACTVQATYHIAGNLTPGFGYFQVSAFGACPWYPPDISSQYWLVELFDCPVWIVCSSILLVECFILLVPMLSVLDILDSCCSNYHMLHWFENMLGLGWPRYAIMGYSLLSVDAILAGVVWSTKVPRTWFETIECGVLYYIKCVACFCWCVVFPAHLRCQDLSW